MRRAHSSNIREFNPLNRIVSSLNAFNNQLHIVHIQGRVNERFKRKLLGQVRTLRLATEGVRKIPHVQFDRKKLEAGVEPAPAVYETAALPTELRRHMMNRFLREQFTQKKT